MLRVTLKEGIEGRKGRSVDNEKCNKSRRQKES